MRRFFQCAMHTHAHPAVILIRLMVGAVFLSEGIQKFLYPDSLGPGRFARIGIPVPEFSAYFTACFEISCGSLVLLGLLTRLAAVPLVVVMLVAIVSTKLPILLGYGFWGFSLRSLSKYGFWSMAHEMRTDFAMLLGSLFLILVGAGRWSLDAWLARTSEVQQARLGRPTSSVHRTGGRQADSPDNHPPSGRLSSI